MKPLLFSLLVLVNVTFAVESPNVVIIIIDGVRDLEWKSQALDDTGKKLPAESIFPYLMSLKRRSLFLPKMKISNPAGVSLPAYADIFTGRRQEKIVNNSPTKKDFIAHTPTLFQKAREAGFKENEVALVASWAPLCQIAATPDAGPNGKFIQDCGWQSNGTFKPEVYSGSKSDSDTLISIMKTMNEQHPRLMLVHLGDGDEEAHQHKDVKKKTGVYYGIFPYHQALRSSDEIVRRVQEKIETDPFYAKKTYLIVTTDHGRDDDKGPTEWSDHGNCALCSGYERVFALISGPGIVGSTDDSAHTHIDLAPTAAKILGFSIPEAKGTPIPLPTIVATRKP